MSAVSERVAKLAKALPAVERAKLADALLSSLDRPDQAIDALWLKECEDRLRALESGEMEWAEFDQLIFELRRE